MVNKKEEKELVKKFLQIFFENFKTSNNGILFLNLSQFRIFLMSIFQNKKIKIPLF
jgi:hypothetical protein